MLPVVEHQDDDDDESQRKEDSQEEEHQEEEEYDFDDSPHPVSAEASCCAWENGSDMDGSGGHSLKTNVVGPVVVGYVFGPKKMSTMGVVMAEASRTQLSSCSSHIMEGLLLDEQDEEEEEDYPGLTHARLSTHEQQGQEVQQQQQHPATTMLFTVEGPHAAGGGGSLQNIVRYFRSSSSSCLEDSLSTGTCTASTTSQRTSNSASLPTTTSTTRSCSSSSQPQQHNHSSTIRPKQHRQTVRVSFVPLDPDTPLEEQHGGQMDVILHKLTEDILCLSQLSKQQQAISHDQDMDSLVHSWVQGNSACIESERSAVRRVHRLLEFQKTAGCSLVDDPLKVQVLMSRQDICQRLCTCLKGVVTASGIPVASPASVALSTPPPDVNDIAEWMTAQTAHLQFPRIVKPLIAAGTKASHKMAVLTKVSACPQLKEFLPCLLQEYANHNAVLYKVYVLGSYVSVHKRRSLPNLDGQTEEMIDFYEFDSQRPYPRLSDFILSKSTTPHQQQQRKYKEPVVTTEELEPVVQALKQAFGLELFGFDLIFTTQEWLVVDVNYFPSYKEVPQFPALLARYLLGRALERRRKKSTV